MNRPTEQHRRQLAAVLAVLLVGSTRLLVASDGPVVFTLPELADLAEQGRFSTVLTSLKAHVHPGRDQRIGSLIQDLESHQRNRRKHDDERAAAYELALGAMAASNAAGKLDQALVEALDAHGLATDTERMRQDERVGQLIDQTERAMHEAEQQGNWAEAANLCRALDLLFDHRQTTYIEKLKKALQHARIMRLYTPRRFYEFGAARTKDNADQIEPYQPSDLTWRQRLAGIHLPMFEQVLSQAQGKHVDGPLDRQLMLAAVESLLILVDTAHLSDTFDGFTEPQKVDTWRGHLVDMRQRLDQEQRPSRTNRALLAGIMRQNTETVDLPEQVIVHEMAQGAVGQLDEFSSVIWPYEKNVFSRNTSGNFTGVGIQISMRDQRLVVVSPLPDTPAYRAGVQAGDIIAEVDAEPTDDWSLERAVRLITGPEGTAVILGIQRQGHNGLLHYAIKRARIEIESVRGWQLDSESDGGWDYWIDPVQHIGYVRLSQFIPKTADGLDDALGQLQADGPLNGLILDLRFNPGGLLKSAVQVCDRFIERGPIVSMVGRGGQAGTSLRAQVRYTHRNVPLVVLINQHSASGSEIVAGAIQDHQRGLVVGVRSFGKGSVQDLFYLDHRQAILKLTTQYYRLPKGRIIHRKPAAATWGIEPNLVVEMTNHQIKDAVEYRRELDVIRTQIDPAEPHRTAADMLAKGLDPQLSAALLILKTRLVCGDLAMARGRDAVPLPSPAGTN